MTVGQLDAELSGLLENLSPAARKKLASDMARDLRRSQQQRIAAQKNPDGSVFNPRKPQIREQSGRVRRAMFVKLRQARWLKTEATADGVAVSFLDRVDRIAGVHQFGLRDQVRPGGPVVRYPARQLLGFTDADEKRITDSVLAWLAS
ncbi:MAG: phage virion morphogenesis protein [Laribacter sp.]|nr:phage virion morphogenesis protein [Laribacter sp.]MBP9527825.1 phage virion morphogenesis protein [Laribacter sp.]MBP9608949.1 phage virion morphogenesis protein [Laribacter sp.]